MTAQTRAIPLRVRTWAFVSIVTIWSARRYSDAVPSACDRLLACLFCVQKKRYRPPPASACVSGTLLSFDC
ncbi:AaceriACL007Cp [[Ashbya] aceris (nom. inval.)]|nr:AaceriACL007Cp [[Ashbya] aceris (nom. inval.)]